MKPAMSGCVESRYSVVPHWLSVLLIQCVLISAVLGKLVGHRAGAVRWSSVGGLKTLLFVSVLTLVVVAGRVQADHVNFTLVGNVVTADPGNGFGLNVGDSITVTGAFDDSGLTGVGAEDVVFSAGSSTSLDIVVGSVSFTEVDDVNYSSGSSPPTLSFLGGAFDGFNFGAIFGEFGSFSSVASSIVAGDDNFFNNRVTGPWTDYSVSPANQLPPTIKAGDLAPLNQPDGTLNAGDVVVMQRFVLGQLQPTLEQSLAADVAPLNQPDGNINAGDMVVLMRAVAGNVTLPPINVPSTGFEPPSLIQPNNPSQQASVTVQGVAAPQQSVNLYLNGGLAASVTADSLGAFQAGVTLLQGPNSLYAVGLVGAQESEPSNMVSVYYGTVLPPVDWQQVAVTDLGGGQIQLVAQPGTVAAGTSVTLTSKSGGTQTVTAGANGSFTATLAGAGTDEPVTIVVDDGAGNSSPASGNKAVGALSGTFLVNETGAATYTVPIEVPPGVAGMQPDLSLNYNSQSGNGILGIGWSLSGLSAITRCPKTWAQDAVYGSVNYDTNDRFCLDGQRLVNVSGNYGADGTVYRTEVDSFSLITQNGTSCGGPCGFTVQTKSGQTLVYGNSDNSRRNVSTIPAALHWAVNSITDVTGNSIQFTYYKNTAGDQRIQSITYANTHQMRRVEFVYETRSDVARGYVAGSLVVSDQRLKTIRTRVGSTIVKEYRLAYNISPVTYASRVYEVTECGFTDTGSETCIPPTRLSWQQGSIGYVAQSFAAVQNTNLQNSNYKWQADFNGDGKNEILIRLGGSLFMYEYAGLGIDVKLSYPTVTNSWGGSAYTFAADFNGDGIADIASRSGSSVFMKLGRSGGFTSTTWSAANTWGIGVFTWSGDFNGDGLADIASRSADGANVYMKLSTGTGFSSQTWPVANLWGNADRTWVADFNGDGQTDIASSSNGNIYMKLSTGTGFTSETWTVSNNWSDVGHTWVKDFNGDGFADIATGKVPPLKVKLSTGSGFIDQSWSITGLPTGYEITLVQDHNGDGHHDLVLNKVSFPVSDEFVAYGNGNGFRTPVNVGYPFNVLLKEGDTVFFGDINGDGKSDWTRWPGPGGFPSIAMKPSTLLPESVVSISPSVGSTVSIAYKSLVEGYQAGYCPGYPVRCRPIPLQVVSDHSVDDGIGGTASFSYGFTNAWIHSRGRGFLGFTDRSVTDQQNGVITTTSYALNVFQTTVDNYPDRYPYSGMISSMKSTQVLQQDPPPPPPPGRVRHTGIITMVNEIYDSMTVTGFDLKQTTAKTYFPYARVKDEVQREVDGQVLSTTTTTTDYDTFGNVTQITAQTVGNNETFTKATVNQYKTTDLRLGRLMRAEVTNTTPDGVVTRTSGFSYYPNGLLQQEIIEPDEADTSPLKQVTDYAYDILGNKTKVSVTALAGDAPASGLQTRTTETQYDSHGLFPVRTVNALGHAETYKYDTRFGTRTRLTGPNNLPTYWEYDALGRLVRETRADGTLTATDYAWCPASICPYGGTRISSETSGSAETVVYRNAQDREIRSESEGLRPGVLIYQDTEYDNFGRIYRKSRPYYAGDTRQWATIAYDQLDRVIEEFLPDAGQVAYTYAPFTKTTTTYILGGDVAQIAKTERFDAMGRLRQVDEELGVTTTFQYDPYDNLASVTDVAGNVTTTEYDRRGRKKLMNEPNMGQWKYRYNGFGELTFQQDNKLQQITMTYDALGRMARRTEPEGTTTWFYDTAPLGIGKLARVNTPNGFVRTLSYGALGRVAADVRLITGKPYQTGYTYDRFGRVSETTYPSGFTTRNVYDTRGILVEVRNATNDALYWQANDADADGQLTRESYGNNLATLRTYDPASGRIDIISTGIGTGTSIQFLDYSFDTVGNLQTRSRSEGTTSLTESFTYDALNRLKLTTISGIGNKNYDYDSLGNINQKGVVNDYRYAERGAGPHAVTFASGQNYDYDNNGNMVSGAGRSITWSSYNKPMLIQKGQTSVRFDYGPNRARFRQIKTVAGVTTTTVYIGKLYEEISTPGQVERKHYIMAGGRAIAVYSDKGAGQTSTQYLHYDHLGSVDVITNASGTLVERLSFSAFGMRRNIDWTDATGLLTSQYITRGFTGHEQLDDVGLVHMNGRVYDPVLGRFLSADPQVQFPASSQSHNRYSYVLNNPLSYTDPSGFGLFSKIKKAFKKVGSAIKKLAGNTFVRSALAIVATYYTFGYVGLLTSNGLLGAAAAGFAGGLIATGTLKGAAIGAVTAAAFYGVGSYFSAAKLQGSASWGKGQLWFGKIVAHGTVGGASSVAQGGSFADGFRSAAFTQLGSPVIGATPGGTIGRTAAAAVVGGTASRLGGGKFANGAQTGAFSRLFNDEQHGDSGRRKVYQDKFTGIGKGATEWQWRSIGQNLDGLAIAAGRTVARALVLVTDLINVQIEVGSRLTYQVKNFDEYVYDAYVEQGSDNVWRYVTPPTGGVPTGNSNPEIIPGTIRREADYRVCAFGGYCIGD